MNHVETVNSIIFNRLYSYKNGRRDKDFRDLIDHKMKYYSGIHHRHQSGKHYYFSATDIELISQLILSDILPR